MSKTAVIIAIGDELLSGRTRDANIHYLAKWLNQRGIALCEVRIIADQEQAIIETVNDVRRRFDYIFTSGGIGPTHDDITAPSIAKALKRKFIQNAQAVQLLTAYYTKRGEALTEIRARMTYMPEKVRLIKNKVSGAPGFQVENIFVMAGVPQIFQAMVEELANFIEIGQADFAMTVRGRGVESQIAPDLEKIVMANPAIRIGSYPSIEGGQAFLSIVIKGDVRQIVEKVAEQIAASMRKLGTTPTLWSGEGKHSDIVDI
ncbi:MAG: competence/damage-inducible protein A [bacterium]